MTFAAWAQSKNKSQLIVKGRRESLPYLIFLTSFPGLFSAESRAGWKRPWHRLTAGYVLSMNISKGTNLSDPLDPCWLLEFRATYIIMTIWMLYGYFNFSVIRKGLLILSMSQSTPKNIYIRNSVCSLCSGAYKSPHMLRILGKSGINIGDNINTLKLIFEALKLKRLQRKRRKFTEVKSPSMPTIIRISNFI